MDLGFRRVTSTATWRREISSVSSRTFWNAWSRAGGLPPHRPDNAFDAYEQVLGLLEELENDQPGRFDEQRARVWGPSLRSAPARTVRSWPRRELPSSAAWPIVIPSTTSSTWLWPSSTMRCASVIQAMTTSTMSRTTWRWPPCVMGLRFFGGSRQCGRRQSRLWQLPVGGAKSMFVARCRGQSRNVSPDRGDLGPLRRNASGVAVVGRSS
jgi:hypothetical protein